MLSTPTWQFKVIFPLVTFLSAFLLFLVQPLIATQILPWFGGSAAVWTTCMVFFQSALLAGYAYADYAPRKLGLKRHGVLHIVLLLASLAWLPILAGGHWKPQGDDQPIIRILVLLVGVIGLPYFLLSSTSPLVQRWFASLQPGRDPYRLFAVSNAASLIALLGYPFVFEPNLGLREQAWTWSAVYGVFVVAIAVLVWHVWQQVTADPQLDHFAPSTNLEAASEAPLDASIDRPWLWVAYSAAGSVMLLAVTNHLTENIASVPLMWLIPLTIYLLTFILCFDGRGWYQRAHFFGPLMVALGAMGWMLLDRNYQFDFKMQSIVFAVGLFVVCMVCHGELVALRPAPSRLTRYYLLISVGGALGAVLVGILAPMLLPAYFEVALALVLVAALSWFTAASMHLHLRLVSLAAVAGTLAVVVMQVRHEFDDAASLTRNFYGTLKVKEYGEAGKDNHLFRMVHGAIMHGEQYRDERWRRTPNTYYTRTSGVGRAILDRRELNRSIRIGMIGLGVGTVAAYGRQGDTVRFYEINPKVLSLAQNYFSYLKDSPASIEVELGDARLVLEREAPQNFDVLAVDAFSGDAIPVHLITLEAVKSFERHLREDGILAFHTSNRFLDLPPLLARIASERKLTLVEISDKPADEDSLTSSSTWVLLAKRAETLAPFKSVSKESTVAPVLWTDDHHNLLQAFKP